MTIFIGGDDDLPGPETTTDPSDPSGLSGIPTATSTTRRPPMDTKIRRRRIDCVGRVQHHDPHATSGVLLRFLGARPDTRV